MAGIAGCESNDLGVCDQGLATAVYYQDGIGLPMYGGQALVYASCGRGAFCHTEGARGPARYGVAAGLDFVMEPDKGGTEVIADALARLRRAQHTTYEERENLYERVASGQMPPGGAAQRETVDGSPVRFHGAPGPLPAINTSAAREILRNWLACGAPVVERTAPLASGAGSTVGDVVSCEDGTATSCLCPGPTFTSIYDVLLAPQCGSVCHTPDVPTQFARNQLDLSTRERAYANLVGLATPPTGVAAMGSDCGGASRRRVVPGDPAHSLLVNKLENCDPTQPRMGVTGPAVCDLEHRDAAGNPDPTRTGFVCGDVMPLGGPASGLDYACFIAPVREWIARGAPND